MNDDTVPASGTIGPYRLLNVLGQGGMAIVYLAEQTAPVRRQVALKIVKLGMDSQQIVSRFESERQALAVLDHPHIAKVFDAGSTEQGRPYFVMEHVAGVAITRYCDEHALDVDARVQLFIDVCLAAQHAHQKGLIHRDLKPSNILVAHVDGRPQVKVIDFGISKAVGGDPQDRTQLTRLGQLIGTPQYMSPEQAELSGLDVDTRTDVYSLGVVLYELLAGSLPLELDRVADYALGLALREREPPTPSVRVSSLDAAGDVARQRGTDLADLRRTLRGDLDWIVMRAIAKDRSARYPTANALAQDLTSYLAHLPVTARPPSTGYLLNRFIRRNKIFVAAASLATLALVVGLAVATLSLVRARAAEATALAEAETARQVSRFLVDVFEVSDPGLARGNSVTAREILDKAAGRIDRELKSAPAVRATLLSTIGRVYARLGLYSEGLPLAESALAIRRQLAPASSELADSLDQVGELRTLLDQPLEANKALQESLLLRRSVAKDPAATAMTIQRLGELSYTQSKFDEALQRFHDAQGILRDNPLAQQPGQRGGLVKYVANIKHEQGDLTASIPLYREALQLMRADFGSDHPDVASTLGDLAIALKDTRQYEEAEQAYLESLAIQRRILGARNPEVGNTLNNLSVFYATREDFPAALRTADEAQQILREALGEDHRLTNIARVNYARDLVRTGDLVAAEAELRAILAIRRRTLPPTHQELGITVDALAAVLNQRGQFAEAEPLAREGQKVMAASVGEAHWRTATAERTVAESLAGQRRFAEAEPLLVSAYEKMLAARGAPHPGTRSTLKRLIEFYETWRKPEKARIYRAKVEQEPATTSSP